MECLESGDDGSGLFWMETVFEGRMGRGRGGDALGDEGISGIAQTGQRLAVRHAAGQLDQLHTGGSRCREERLGTHWRRALTCGTVRAIRQGFLQETPPRQVKW